MFYKYLLYLMIICFYIPSACYAAHAISVPWHIEKADIEIIKKAINSDNKSEIEKYADDVSDPDLKSMITSISKQNKNIVKDNESSEEYFQKEYQVNIHYPSSVSTPSIKLYSDKKRPEDTIVHINSLLEKKQYSKVVKLSMTLNDSNHYDIVMAKLSMSTNHPNTKQIFERIEKHTDFTLVAQYVTWLINNSEYKEAIKILLKFNNHKFSNCSQNMFWKMKKNLIKKVDFYQLTDLYEDAYTLSISDESSLFEVNWLAAWISFHAQNFQRAKLHFEKAYQHSSSDIYLSKSAYWAALVSEKMGYRDASEHWLKIAATKSREFYGQLALLALNPKETISLNINSTLYSQEDYIALQKNIDAKRMYIAAVTGNPEIAKTFFDDASQNANSNGEMNLLTTLAIQKEILNLNLKNIIVLNNHDESLLPIIMMNHFYNRDLSTLVDPAFSMSILKKESQFRSDSISSVGAKGLMQIMPSTAAEVANNIHLEYSDSKLLDPQYNMLLGVNYLKTLLKAYNNSLILAAAAYNAGYGNVRKWMKNIGNPNTFNSLEEVLTWIERIPFTETKFYIYKVVANTQIYRSLSSTKNRYEISNMRKDLLNVR